MFVCSAVEPFDLFDLPAWVERSRASGEIAGPDPVSLEVRHPEREMDNSCRWCGMPRNEVVTIVDGRIVS